MDLDHAKDLVARILEFVADDQQRLRHFLTEAGFSLESAQDLAQSPAFMVSVLDTILKNEMLLAILGEREGIRVPLIELTRARLSFHLAAEMTRQSEEDAQALAIKERVRTQLRTLSRLSPRRSL